MWACWYSRWCFGCCCKMYAIFFLSISWFSFECVSDGASCFESMTWKLKRDEAWSQKSISKWILHAKNYIYVTYKSYGDNVKERTSYRCSPFSDVPFVCAPSSYVYLYCTMVWATLAPATVICNHSRDDGCLINRLCFQKTVLNEEKKKDNLCILYTYARALTSNIDKIHLRVREQFFFSLSSECLFNRIKPIETVESEKEELIICMDRDFNQ